MLTLLAETYIAEQLAVVDPQRIHAVREAMREALALALYDDWLWAFEANQHTGAYAPDATVRPPRPGQPRPQPAGVWPPACAATPCGPARPCNASKMPAT